MWHRERSNETKIAYFETMQFYNCKFFTFICLAGRFSQFLESFCIERPVELDRVGTNYCFSALPLKRSTLVILLTKEISEALLYNYSKPALLR